MVAHVIVSIALCGLVLLQRGKGADAGAAFGSGASGTVFGARGSANFLSRATAVLATVFFINSLALAYLTTQRGGVDSVVDTVVQPVPDAVQTPAPEADDLGDVPSIDVPEVEGDAEPTDSGETDEASEPAEPTSD